MYWPEFIYMHAHVLSSLLFLIMRCQAVASMNNRENLYFYFDFTAVGLLF